MQIELAPNNKQGLALASRLIAGSGAVGFGDAWPDGVPVELFGAVVTPPITWQPRRGQPPPRLAEIPGGFVLATGDHNPGLKRLLRSDATDWARLGLPAIAAFASSAPQDWDRLAGHLEDQPGVAGLELHLPPQASARDTGIWVANVRRNCQLPVLVKLPAGHAELLVDACVHAGADTLVIAAPPVVAARALLPATDPPNGFPPLVEGYMGGLAAFPHTLRALAAVLALAPGLPIIAAGGITRLADARLCFEMGAAALQIRSLLWTDPAAVVQLAKELT
jgi:dihydroorotate dehydrogenase (NAD+) catalytic subunit